MTATAFPYLTTLVLLPAVGAAVVALIPRKAVAAWFHEARRRGRHRPHPGRGRRRPGRVQVRRPAPTRW